MNWRPGPSVRDGPSPLPPVPIDSARPSVAWDTGSWQVAQAMSRFPLKTLSNMSAWPRSTSAAGWAGVGPIGTVPHLLRLCRRSASSDAGGPEGVFHPSQPVASTSRPRYVVLTKRVIIVHLQAPGSAQRERDGELVRDHVYAVERHRRAHRGEEARRDIGHGVGDESILRRNQPIRPVGHAPAVSQLELREAEGQAPRRRPFEPRFFQMARDPLDMVLLREVVVNGAHREAELQGGGPGEGPERDLATHADADQRVREVKAVFDRPAPHRDRTTTDRDDRRLGLGPGGAPNRLVHDVHAEHRRPVGAGNADAELVRGGAPRVLRDGPDVAVRPVGLRDAIAGRQPADAPFRCGQRTLVFDLYSPPLGEIAIALEAGTLQEPLGARIPEHVEESHFVRHAEPLV